MLGLCAGALVATGSWAWQREDLFGWLVWLAVAALAARSLWRARRRPLMTLRWDGDRWWLARPSDAAGMAGEVAVALDLGAWLLLRFRAEPRDAGRQRQVWLPLQRGGLQADWHALRCALYSPRPQAAAPAAPDSSG